METCILAMLDIHVQVLAVGDCRVALVRRGWDCPVPGAAGSSRPIAGHSQVPQPSWWHLCENMLRKCAILTKVVDR